MIKRRDLAEFYKNARPDELAKPLLRRILVNSLNSTQGKVYEAVVYEGIYTCVEISSALGLKQNQVGRDLKTLVDYGILERASTYDSSGGPYYVYSYRSDNNPLNNDMKE